MRIRPSQSTVMKRKVGSTASFTTVRFEAVALGNRGPVVDAGAAERIHAQADLRAANRVHVDHIAEIAHVSIEIVMPVRRGWRAEPSRKDIRCTPCRPLFRNSLAFASIQPVTFGIGRPAVGRVVLEAAIIGRIVRGRDDDAVGESCRAPAVVGEDRVRNRRRRRVFVALASITSTRWPPALRARLRTPAPTAHACRCRGTAARRCCWLSVVADRLSDREHMPFVERLLERRAAMPRGAERNPLRRHRRIGHVGVVRGDELRHVDERRLRC